MMERDPSFERRADPVPGPTGPEGVAGLEYDPHELIPRVAIGEWFDGKQIELGQRLADLRSLPPVPIPIDDEASQHEAAEQAELHKGEISNVEGQLEFMGEIARSLQNLPIAEETIETATGAEYDPKKLIPRSVIVEWFAREHAALGEHLAELQARPFPTVLVKRKEIDKHQGEIFKLQGRLELLDDIARSLRDLKVTNE